MAQIFCLAASISPPMLPVVSRQNTTSTFGLAFAFAGASAAGAGEAHNTRAANAAGTAARAQERDRHDMVHSCTEKGRLRSDSHPLDERGPAWDCPMVAVW